MFILCSCFRIACTCCDYTYPVLCDGPWWRHQMETFSALLALCAGNSPVSGEFPAQRPVTRSFDVFFDLHLNKRLSKKWWGWWFETPVRPLWRHCNAAVLWWRCSVPSTSDTETTLLTLTCWVVLNITKYILTFSIVTWILLDPSIDRTNSGAKIHVVCRIQTILYALWCS